MVGRRVAGRRKMAAETGKRRIAERGTMEDETGEKRIAGRAKLADETGKSVLQNVRRRGTSLEKA